jgi:serine/threonine protein kinase
MTVIEDQARSIFFAALERAPEQWRAFLAETCADNAELQVRVEQLLRAHRAMGGIHGGGADAPVAITDEPVIERPGTIIGPYKLLEQIGEGGFGIVFMAEQQHPVRRKVALKVLKPGMDSHQVIARFEAERQALALMDHPNIAKILDAGTTGESSRHTPCAAAADGTRSVPATVIGRPYFVMELVKGMPITEFSDQSQSTPRQRLELFVHVCQAVQHAHQKGIIHRDLKPSNVMVTMQDGAPLVKVIDFGIAKALSQQLTDKTLFTGFAQMLGSPLYMSPEQVALSNVDVDTRSDIYSLGVLLYELLTGTTPFDKERFKEASYDEMRRIIREEDPPKPSTRISTLGQAATTLSTHRKADPKRLSQLFRGELDWIVMKCLEKDRNRRYATAHDLARDIERYLHDEPVHACPPSVAYRFRKFARRNRMALAIAGLLTATLVLAIVGLATSNLSISREKDRAEKALWEKQEALGAAEANLLLARQAVDQMYTDVSGQIGDLPYMQPFQRDVLQKALRFYEQFAGRQSSDPAIRLETASARLRVGQVQYTLGQRRQAKQACDEALAALEELGAQLPAEPKHRSWLAAAYYVRGYMLASEVRCRHAAKSYRQALALWGKLAAEQPDIPDHRSQLAATHLALGGVLTDRPGEAEKEVREGVRLYEKLVAEPSNPTDYRYYRQALIGSYISRGNFLAYVERSQEAERAYRQAIDLCDTSAESLNRTSGPWLRAGAEFALGEVLTASRRRGEAEQAYRRGLAVMERAADQFPDVPGYRQSLAVHSGKLAALLDQSGSPDEAAVLRRSARTLFEKLAAESPDDEELLNTLANAGMYLRDAGDLEAAAEFARKSVILAAKLAEGSTEPFDRQRVAGSHGALGTILQRRGRLGDAADQFRQALALYEQLAAEFPDETQYRDLHAKTLNSQGVALRTLPGEAATALRCHQQALELCQQLISQFPDQPGYRKELVRSHFGRGIALRLAGHPAEAVQAFQQALDAYHPYSGTAGSTESLLQFASVHNELAWLLATWPDLKFRDPGRALALASKAVELEPEKGEFWNTLGLAHYRAGQWRQSKDALEKSMKLFGGKSESFNTFFLAMAHWQLGEQEESRQWYRQAVAWMEKNQRGDHDLRRFRAEAAELLGVREEN